MDRKELKELLNTLGIRLSKSSGQHILVDEGILAEEVRMANVRSTDIVLEIGTGPGTLTRVLAGHAGKVITVENDLRFQSYLETVMPDNVKLIFDDFLKIDLPGFHKVVANVPYNISSPIIFKLLEHEFTAGILMLQLEYAERMVAGAGDPDYSRLSVKIDSKAHCEMLRKVSRNHFHPIPRVDSAMVELVPREPSYHIEDRETFDRVVDAVFNQKRKKIKNALLNKHRWFGIEKDRFKPVVSDLARGHNRGEDLSPAELAELSNTVFGMIKDIKSEN